MEQVGASPTVWSVYSPPFGHFTIPFFKKGARSVSVGLSVAFLLFCKAHCCFAWSIARRLFMQAFICAVSRALMKLGIAMASIIGITNRDRAIPIYPVTKPATAKPCPVRAPLEFFMRESALCPQ